MSRTLPPRPNLDQLKLQAKELQRERQVRDPGFQLADAQLELAREYGFDTWAALKHHVESLREVTPFEEVAADVLAAYQADDDTALQRVRRFFKHSVTFSDVRRGVQRILQKERDASITLPDAREAVARLRGFASWAALAAGALAPAAFKRTWGRPLYIVDETRNLLRLERPPEDVEWDEIVSVLRERRIATLEANGEMTDAGLARISAIDHITSLNCDGSRELTDAGYQHLSRMPQLTELALGGWLCPITDRGLDALQHLTRLRRFQLTWAQKVTDAGVAHLARCHDIERVGLMGSSTGDGAIRALMHKPRLRHLQTGKNVTDAGLPLLHHFPVFKTWHGDEEPIGLMSFNADPQVLLDGPITNEGLRRLSGLDGIFGFGFFWHAPAITSAGLGALAGLANLGVLGCGGELCNDEAMRHIARIPKLRLLQGQGTVATDAGFEALSQSRSLEYLWGRECPNLGSRGFRALATMPSLRGLGVSCKYVDDAALATLPDFPALQDLMPMDVDDHGFRHVAASRDLERLWCMYCRNTTDAATERIASLPKLRTYYAGQTKITDRSLEILGGMATLEEIEFWNCPGITNGGAQHLARLPHLKTVTFSECRAITRDVTAVFPSHVRVQT